MLSLLSAPRHKLKMRSRIVFVGLLLLLSSCAIPKLCAQTPLLAPPILTPSTVTIVVGDGALFTFSNESGVPVANVHCTVEPPIADVKVEKDEIRITAIKPGRAVITATFDNQIATAVATIVNGVLPKGTVVWSVLPTPGFETLLARQTTPTSESDIGFYSIEWNKTSNAILRAFQSSGRQLWRVKLSSTASPIYLKHTLPAPGEVFLNDVKQADKDMFIIGDKGAFSIHNPPDPSFFHLPPDGQSMLMRTSGGNSGGLFILERGRFRDSFVEIGAAGGQEVWRYRSQGRLQKNWTVNQQGDVGIVETFASPPSAGLIVLNGATGQVKTRIPFPPSSSTINGFRCQDPKHNVLISKRTSPAGSVFTSTDGNMYVQIETHVESVDQEGCRTGGYSFDNTLSLLRVTPEGETEWKVFQRVHADGKGEFVVQPRLYAGESIPDGFGGVLAAWTYMHPGNKDGVKVHPEARLSRISASTQRDFNLPMAAWTEGINSFFDENMVLGEGNPLYATNGYQLFRFDTEAGELNWVRQPPTGKVKLLFSAAGGGLFVTNAGVMDFFDAQGNGTPTPWTVSVSNPDDVGLVQADPFEQTPLAPLQLREVELLWRGNFLAVEDGAPYGKGSLLSFTVN